MLARAVATECDVNFISIKVIYIFLLSFKIKQLLLLFERDLNSCPSILEQVKNQYAKLFVGMSSLFVAFKIRTLFFYFRARSAKPCILFFDEFESLAPR